nr:MAG TPA: hypothetical protein [Caudoviricetes sp.]
MKFYYNNINQALRVSQLVGSFIFTMQIWRKRNGC